MKHSFLLRAAASAALFLPVGALAQSIPLARAPDPSLSSPDLSYGGTHEFGVWAGYSPLSGGIWGYSKNVRYSPLVLRYSYLLVAHERWNLRYAPELTALASLYERAPSLTDPAAPVRHFGAGFTPEGLQLVLRPRERVQPFFSHAGGFLYFADRVLSPGGSQFMYTVDLGGGVNLFASRQNAWTLGYRYQHLSNANISRHNPGTDANTISLGFSHFDTKRTER